MITLGFTSRPTGRAVEWFGVAKHESSVRAVVPIDLGKDHKHLYRVGQEDLEIDAQFGEVADVPIWSKVDD